MLNLPMKCVSFVKFAKEKKGAVLISSSVYNILHSMYINVVTQSQIMKILFLDLENYKTQLS